MERRTFRPSVEDSQVSLTQHHSLGGSGGEGDARVGRMGCGVIPRFASFGRRSHSKALRLSNFGSEDGTGGNYAASEASLRSASGQLPTLDDAQGSSSIHCIF